MVQEPLRIRGARSYGWVGVFQSMVQNHTDLKSLSKMTSVSSLIGVAVVCFVGTANVHLHHLNIL